MAQGIGNQRCVPNQTMRLANSLVQSRVAWSDLESYLPFIGIVSLVGQDDKLRIGNLRDTGAFDIFYPILPFSSNTFTGSVRPVVGMGSKVVVVPLHKIIFNCDLF